MLLQLLDKDYTLKNYYIADSPSDDETRDCVPLKITQNATKRTNDIEVFFEKPKKKKSAKQSSCVGQSNNGGVAYIATGEDDASNASHLVKIEVYEMSKIRDVPPTDYWKHTDVRVKYYAKSEDDKHYQTTRDLIYNITKQLSAKRGCAKFFVEAKQ